MSIRTIEENGKRFAVLPWEQWEALRDSAEMAADVAAYDYAQSLAQEAFPISLYDAIDKGEHPVRVLRDYRGMTQEQLAKAVGVERPLISDIENRKKSGSIKTLNAIAQVLHVALYDMV